MNPPTQFYKNKQARKPRATLVWNYDLLTHLLTYLLTRVKCRATSVAKKQKNPQQTPTQLLKRTPVFLCRGALSASKYYPSARGYYVASWKVFVEAPAQFAKAWLIGLLLTLLQQLFQCTAVHNVLFLGSIFTSQLNKLRPTVKFVFLYIFNIYLSSKLKLVWLRDEYIFLNFCEFQTTGCFFHWYPP